MEGMLSDRRRYMSHVQAVATCQAVAHCERCQVAKMPWMVYLTLDPAYSCPARSARCPKNMHTLRLPWLDSNPVAPELQRQCSSLGMTQAARLGPPPGPDQEHLDV